MKNLFSLLKTTIFVSFILSFFPSYSQTITLNGGTQADWGYVAGSPWTAPYCNTSAYGTSTTYPYVVELKISNTLPTCTTKVVARRAKDATFAALTSPNTVTYNGVTEGQWNTSLSYSTGTFYKAQAGTPQADALATGMVNANGTYEILLGGAGGTNYWGYYEVVVTCTNAGVNSTYLFQFILQDVSQGSYMSYADLNATTSSCSTRPTSSVLTYNTAHLGVNTTLAAQLYNGGSTVGSTVTYVDPGAAGGFITTHTYTMPNITANGNYRVKYKETFAAQTYSGSPLFGTPVNLLPMWSSTLAMADMTGGSPISYTLTGTESNTTFGSNTAATYYKICSKTSGGANSVLNFILAGTSSSSTVTTTAVLTQYTTSAFTTASGLNYTLFSGTGGWDGIYDLTAVSSNYLKTNPGYYKLTVSSSSSSCGSTAISATYYFYWAGPPVGTALLGHLNGSGVFVPDGTTTCNSGALIVGSSAGSSGSLTGVTMKLENSAGVIFDGLAGTKYDAGGTISSWASLSANVQSYASFLGTPALSNYFTQYVLAASGSTFTLTVNVYNDVCSGTPTQFVFNITKSNASCKTDETTGITDITSDVLSVYPNPTSGQLNVLLSAENINAKVSLYDMQGRQANVPVSAQSATEVSMDLSGLAKGVYILAIDGKRIAKKITVD